MKKVDALQHGLAAALADVREKLVEEPWFGRSLTPTTVHQGQSLAEALGWAMKPAEAGQRDLPDPGMGHER